MKKIKIIAEVGPNHNGSFEIAKDYVRKLAKYDLDIIKFQIANPEDVYSKDSFKADYQKVNDKSKTVIEMSKKNQLSREEHIKLSEECLKHNKIYAATAFDIGSLSFISKNINLPFLKIPSGEVCSIDLLEFIKNSNKEILLSTGMSSIDEIKKTIEYIDPKNNKNITILHCTSSYPAEIEDLNLNFLDKLRLLFPNYNLGYSDHSIGDEACLLALAKGATIIEKHVTIDRNLDGPDHKSSMSIDDFGKFVNKIRKCEIILGQNKKIINTKQKKIREMALKSIVTRRDIKKGEVLDRTNICFKRPGIGLNPLEFDSILGCKVKKDIEADRVIMKEDINYN